ncbi:MAG: phospholipase/carboxylesterase [Chthonomonadales bacterium]|nr:phospholipase/carboxylesterase [Chthonomonadales bacterium]
MKTQNIACVRSHSQGYFRQILRLCIALALGSIFAPTAQAGPGVGSHDETLMHDGVLRQYRLHVPTGHNANQAMPLVLMLHGRGGNGKGFEQTTGMSEVADKENFLVAYPYAVGKPPAWTSGLNEDLNNGDDIGFLKALINKLESAYKIDPHRIYCAGFSSGATMSEVVGAKLSEKVAAIGVVEGYIGTEQNGHHHIVPNPAVPVSLIEFHGKLDQTTPYNGGHNPYLPNGVVLPVSKSIDFWVNHDGCDTTPNVQNMDNGTIERDAYRSGKQGTEVVFFSLAQGKHQWPTPSVIGISASNHIWEFFKAHPKQ